MRRRNIFLFLSIFAINTNASHETLQLQENKDGGLTLKMVGKGVWAFSAGATAGGATGVLMNHLDRLERKDGESLLPLMTQLIVAGGAVGLAYYYKDKVIDPEYTGIAGMGALAVLLQMIKA